MFLSQVRNRASARTRLSSRRFQPRLEALEERRLLSISEFATPTPYSYPEVITSGPDGNLWFTEQSANKIARATPDGSITEFPIQTPNAGLMGITAGPDGNLWFTEYSGNKIGSLKLQLLTAAPTAKSA
jgi:hypothetical protein